MHAGARRGHEALHETSVVLGPLPVPWHYPATRTLLHVVAHEHLWSGGKAQSRAGGILQEAW